MPTTLSFQTERPRFTLDGSLELEQQLEALCGRIRRAVLRVVAPPKLEALVLGGGYGRGQGGVMGTDSGEAPYNDLEFYVFIRGNPLVSTRKHGPAFRQLERDLSPGAGLHVEFKIDSLAQLERRAVSIFSYDLVSGHRILQGGPAIFSRCAHHAEAPRILGSEATRLLLNRCSGLLLAKELLQKDYLRADECDFIGRNLAKVQLALGDALLVLEGHYHWDCLERARRLRQLRRPGIQPLLERVLEHHSAGIRFKLHPCREETSLETFRTAHRTLTGLALEEWLWIENERLGARFSDLGEYAFSPVEKSSGRGFWPNLLLNLRTFGPAALLERNCTRYPRQRLLNTLPILLKERLLADGQTRRYVQRQLHTRAQDWRGLVAAYKRLWSCYG